MYIYTVLVRGGCLHNLIVAENPAEEARWKVPEMEQLLVDLDLLSALITYVSTRQVAPV